MTQATLLYSTATGLPEPTRTPLLTGSDPEHKRRELLAYFCQTFDLYDSLFDCLADDRARFDKAIPCATRSSSTTATPPPSSSTSCWRPALSRAASTPASRPWSPSEWTR